MSIFQCDECGCAENTAYSNYFYEHSFLKGPKLCSVCTKIPESISRRKPGWHGKFARIFLPKGMFITNRVGNLMHKETKETDYIKYALPGSEKPYPISPLFPQD